MATFSFDLPFFVPLDEGEYALSASDQNIAVHHSVVQQADLDRRIGDVKGSFGFVRDQLGVLRYSKLSFELSESGLERLSSVLFSEGRPKPGATDHEAKGRIALAVCNQFLDKYRVAARKADVKPLGPWDLARLHFEDGQTSGDLRLYGGGITLSVVGLLPEYHDRVIKRLADPDPPAVYETAAVNALRSVEDGQALESIVTATGALEAGLDVYFARSWRLNTPPTPLQEAAAVLGVGMGKPPELLTLDDVLEKAGVRSKVKAYAGANGLSDEVREGLYEAIELRNLAVHGGVRVPAHRAKPHVEAVARFVLDQLATGIRRECPGLPRAEVLYACEEALGDGCSVEIQQLADTYLTAAGLTARLLNYRFARRQMLSERFGDTLVMRISFRDFPADDVNLFIARALLYHSLELSGVVASARAADELPDGERPFFRAVASELTLTVWTAAIDNRLRGLGFENAIRQDAERQAEVLRKLYGPSYARPAFSELGHWVDCARLARAAAALPLADRGALLEMTGRAAPETTRRAVAATPALERANYGDPASIRDALIQVHDASETILASVTILDPTTGERHGRGLKFEDIFDFLS